MTQILSYRLVSVHQLDAPTGTCEHCGHAIAQLFYLQDTQNGARLVVGSDCVQHFLALSEYASAEKLARRINRAASQWRKQTPASRLDETRTDYINRRTAEMANALPAYRAWIAACNKRPVTGQRVDEYWAEMLPQIEQQHCANRFDFTRALWDVRKI